MGVPFAHVEYAVFVFAAPHGAISNDVPLAFLEWAASSAENDHDRHVLKASSPEWCVEKVVERENLSTFSTVPLETWIDDAHSNENWLTFLTVRSET